MDKAITSDKHVGRSNSGEQDPENSKLDCFITKSPALTDGIYKAENVGVGTWVMAGAGGVDLAADQAQGEQLEGAVECRFNNFGRGRVESHDEGLQEEIGIGRREAIERGAGSWIDRVVNDRIKLVQSGLAGGDELLVFPPGDVLDDLIKRRTQYPATAGRPA